MVQSLEQLHLLTHTTSQKLLSLKEGTKYKIYLSTVQKNSLVYICYVRAHVDGSATSTSRGRFSEVCNAVPSSRTCVNMKTQQYGVSKRLAYQKAKVYIPLKSLCATKSGASSSQLCATHAHTAGTTRIFYWIQQVVLLRTRLTLFETTAALLLTPVPLLTPLLLL